jgi:hypothetical protein
MESRFGAKQNRYCLPLMRLPRAFLVVIMSVVASSASAIVPTDDAGLTAFAADAFAKGLPEAKVTIKGPLLLDLETSSSEGSADAHVTKSPFRKASMRLSTVSTSVSRSGLAFSGG